MLSHTWHTSTRCASANCVQARRSGHHTVLVRDSKQSGPGSTHTGPVLEFPTAAWRHFLSQLTTSS